MVAVENPDSEDGHGVGGGDDVESYCSESRTWEVRVGAAFLKSSDYQETIQKEHCDARSDDVYLVDEDAMEMVQCRRDKYHRKIQSRRRQEKRQRLKREYRRWDGKSKEKRIRRKM